MKVSRAFHCFCYSTVTKFMLRGSKCLLNRPLHSILHLYRYPGLSFGDENANDYFVTLW